MLVRAVVEGAAIGVLQHCALGLRHQALDHFTLAAEVRLVCSEQFQDQCGGLNAAQCLLHIEIENRSIRRNDRAPAHQVVADLMFGGLDLRRVDRRRIEQASRPPERLDFGARCGPLPQQVAAVGALRVVRKIMFDDRFDRCVPR